MQLTPEEQQKQIAYRDARSSGTYGQIWQSVGKCVFCDLNEKYVFFEEHGIVMTISLFAYIDGHFMIIPRRHIRSPRELTQLEWDTIRKFTYIAKKIIKEVHGVSGMQLVQKDGANAQSTVDQHLHFHCIPFDAPDLCEWNYRTLKYTPLENVALYKKDRKKIIEHGLKFDKKYRQPASVRIVTDLIAVNTKREVLFQHRVEGAKLTPDYLTLPGGGVEDFGSSLEAELAREVFEETGLQIDTSSVRLIASRLDTMKYAHTSRHLNVKYATPVQFLWNSYILTGVDPDSTLTPGDDCDKLEWIPIDDIHTRDNISPEIRELLGKLDV
jgi:diadenosine tetraphosphate (Ap4A) HIT family hydrolase/8-oxo-dGTP pyrophosphatase MutT (NUDIX family)